MSSRKQPTKPTRKPVPSYAQGIERNIEHAVAFANADDPDDDAPLRTVIHITDPTRCFMVIYGTSSYVSRNDPTDDPDEDVDDAGCTFSVRNHREDHSIDGLVDWSSLLLTWAEAQAAMHPKNVYLPPIKGKWGKPRLIQVEWNFTVKQVRRTKDSMRESFIRTLTPAQRKLYEELSK